MDVISSVSLFGVAVAHPLSYAGGRVAAAAPAIGRYRWRSSEGDPSPQALREDESDTAVRLDERDRIARELHDSTSQLLVALELQLMHLKSAAHSGGYGRCDDIVAGLGATIAELHEGIRAVALPAAFDPAELREKLMAMAAEFSRRTGIRVEGRIAEVTSALPPQVAATVFRVAQEALANVSRHASATKVRLRLRLHRCTATLRISDNGKGFPRPARRGFNGHGISNMRARVLGLGGRISISNLAHGAAIEAKIPL